MSKSDLDGDITCPYCGIKDDCKHVFLLVNATLRQSAGGILYEVFDDVWQYAKNSSKDGDYFDEESIFNDLLEVVSANSDYEIDYVLEGGLGETFFYHKYYCKQIPTVIDISHVNDDLYSIVADENINALTPYNMASDAWNKAFEGVSDFQLVPQSILEIIAKKFNLSSLPIKLQTELLVRFVDTSADAPEIVGQISANWAHDIYTQLVNSYPEKLSSVQRYLNKYISFAKEKVTWRRLGYVGTQQRTPDAAIQGALLLHKLLVKEE